MDAGHEVKLLADEPHSGEGGGKTKAALEAARRRLEFLMSATPAVVYTCRPRGDFGATFMSPNVLALTGYEAREFLATSTFWFDRVHPDDQPRVVPEVARLLEDGRHSWEYRFRHADGTYIWVHDSLVVECDANGAPEEFVGYWVDVTARREAVDALRRSEARFRTLIECSPTGVLVHREGRILYANPALVAVLGYERADELVGRSSLEVVHPEERAAIAARQEKTYGGVHTAPREQRLLRRDGSTVVVEAEGLRMDFDGGGAAVVLVRDLTERRELLARLAIADRMLSVGTLAAGVAHEINNPLTYVLMNTHILAEELPSHLGLTPDAPPPRRTTPAQAASLAREVHEGATRIRLIVSDLLSLARGDRSNVGAIDVRHVLDTATKMAGNEIHHRARLVERIDLDLPPVIGDESRLVQVFLNLLLNAAQAIPDGHAAEHEVRLAARLEGERVAITVEDTGIGIPRSAIGRIFDPFFTTKQAGTGTGLGLSICHRIVSDLGGEIGVESEQGRGARFRVALPIAGAPTTAVPAPKPESRVQPRRLQILAIDDQALVATAISLALAPEADVVVETRARAALARLEAGERYDIIFCDLMMPEMNGMDFHAAVTDLAPDVCPRIIFLSGGAFTASARAFLERVPNRCLAKPLDLAELDAALRIAAG